jgi:DNA-binding MarR family transcriptional regulator
MSTIPAKSKEPPPSGEVRWLDENEQRAWRSLQIMQARLTALLAHDLSAHSELSYQDYVVLVALTDQPGGQMRLFQLGNALGWEKSRMSHQVSRMVERGLVEKSKCGSDRRGAFVAVTDVGRQEIRAAAPSHLEAVRRLFVDLLTPSQLANVAEVAETVLTAVTDEERQACTEAGHEPCAADDGEGPPGSSAGQAG